MAVIHLAAFTWKQPLPAEVLQGLRGALTDLAGEVPGVESYDLRPDLAMNPANADFGVVARFADPEAFRTYWNHPRRRDVNERFVQPNLAAKSVVQFEI